MQLFKILDGISCDYDKNIDAMEVSGIAHSSKAVKTGNIFICLDGKTAKGSDYAKSAIEKGARAVVCERPLSIDVPQILVKDARAAFAILSKNFYNKACDKMKIVGVTGTNGKTTTVNMVADILKSAGKKVATVGTMGISYNGNVYETGFTTPDPNALHEQFEKMLQSGIEYVIMEASAHAIALKKLAGINFEIGVLTNITQDHLDFFETMENYAKCKLSFFNKNNMKLGIVCADDEKARTLLHNANLPIISYGLENPSDVFAINIDSNFQSTRFVCNCLDDIFAIKTNLAGRYNVSNALAAIATARALGVDKEKIANSLRYITPVEGRFNVIHHPKCNIVIDYAHTPDGLENVLKTAKELTKGKLIALFGCGGNRDRKKRPIMGKIAREYADEIILTSDNPRDEDPYSIIDEIASGIKDKQFRIIENRAQAIAWTLDGCEKDDTLVIAGKGGEKYQEIKGKKIPYNDFDAVYQYFRDNLTDLKRRDDEHNS